MAIILLVDDDPLQAACITSLLERQFGEVRRVTDAAEALCLIEQPEFAGRLGLVISGHHTPGIGGPAFVAELHARVPELPVLVLGSPEEAQADYADDHIAFLPRPAAGKEMLAMTRRILEQCRHAAA
ncbi:MAG: response regulator [Terracidiphilus sp.]|jgi:two-component system C4-dicarboxylate transport response regulator DctD